MSSRTIFTEKYVERNLLQAEVLHRVIYPKKHTNGLKKNKK